MDNVLAKLGHFENTIPPLYEKNTEAKSYIDKLVTDHFFHDGWDIKNAQDIFTRITDARKLSEKIRAAVTFTSAAAPG